MSIALLPAPATDNRVLDNLLQLYHHDLSEYNSKDVDAQGRFTTTRLTAHPAEGQIEPFLIYADTQIAGLLIIGRHSLLCSTFVGHSLNDLFILRRYRRQGIGRAAATLAFGQRPGSWEVAADARNIPGHVFCRSVIDRYTGGRYTETWLQTPHWHGPVQSFSAPAVP